MLDFVEKKKCLKSILCVLAALKCSVRQIPNREEKTYFFFSFALTRLLLHKLIDYGRRLLFHFDSHRHQTNE